MTKEEVIKKNSKKELSASEKSKIEAGKLYAPAKEFIECVKLHAEAIKERIDVEHSVSIHYSSGSCMSPLYIIELKASDPEKERTCLVFTEGDFRSSLGLTNAYIMAATSLDILPNIPQWKDELEAIKYRSGGIKNRGWSYYTYAKLCQQMACPEKGAFTAYKQVFGNDHKPYICELLIPEDALRSSGFERKCRAEKAKVIAIWALEYGDADQVLHFIKTRRRVAHSFWDKKFSYRVGETVTPTNGFDMDRFNTCAPGIHFYMTMTEAAIN